jgi:hypothetical protein
MKSDGGLTALIMCLALLLIYSSGVQGRIDPATNRIRLLMIGEINAEHQAATSYMFADPKVDLTLIPAGDIANPKTSKRFVRIYMPRNKDKLVDGFDVLELFDFVPYILENQHIVWMRDAVRDHGLGLALTEMGWYGVTDWTGNDAAAWMATVLYDAYPVEMVLEKQNEDTPFMDIREETPLVDLPGFEQTQMTGVTHHGIEIARAGSTVHTVWRVGGEDAIVSGEYGEGVSLMIPMGWDNVPRGTEVGWFYYVDFVLNHIYFVAQVKLPDDLEVIHQLRSAFVRYQDEKGITTSLLEFIDKFGANTKAVEEMIMEIEGEKDDAEYLYLTDDYAGSWEIMRDVLDGFKTISEEAVKIRERALLWVYVTEWLAVTGTLIICGTIIWTLMVRRRLYREVATTRGRL